MIWRSLALWCLSALLAAADIELTPPIDCDLGRECYIQQYVDHDPGKGARDFRCSSLSYDTHKGTDFAVKTYARMQAGVDVIAAAPGRVTAVRDGEPDRLYGGKFGEVPSNRACGNGLIIAHDDNWTTQYCHLRKGSLTVQTGQIVKRGAPLGQIGLSGRTQFPHVHLTLRHNNKVIDPFDPDGQITCGAPSEDTLWQTPLTYQPGGVLDTGFADGVPDYSDVKSGTAKKSEMPRTAPAIVLFGFAFGGRTDDIMHLRIDGPGGLRASQKVRLTKNQAQFFRAYGKKRPAGNWAAGTYRGTVELVRDGKVINSNRTTVKVR